MLCYLDQVKEKLIQMQPINIADMCAQLPVATIKMRLFLKRDQRKTKLLFSAKYVIFQVCRCTW